jgi:glutaconate CoA-transferase, subunit A
LRRAVPVRDLTLLCFTGGLETDLLIGAGMVAAVRSAYVGLQEFGLAPQFTHAATAGTVRVIEETEASLACGLRAAMSGVGFVASRAWVGTDLPALRPDVKRVLDPYSGEELTAFPPIRPDIAVLHALEADDEGNAKLNYNLGVDLELAYTAGTVIVTVERRVARVERDGLGPVLPAQGIHYLVLAHGGAAPTSCYPHYPLDGLALLDYVEALEAGTLAEWLAAR